MKVIIINGFPQAGKDTFVELCKGCIDEVYPDTSGSVVIRELWASTPAKMALKYMGWDGKTKTPEIRDALCLLKALSESLFDWTMEYLKREMAHVELRHPTVDVVVIHCREPELIARLKKEFNAITLFIQRDSCVKYHTNSSDNNVCNYSYDYIVNNNSTIQKLERVAKSWMKEVLG